MTNFILPANALEMYKKIYQDWDHTIDSARYLLAPKVSHYFWKDNHIPPRKQLRNRNRLRQIKWIKYGISQKVEWGKPFKIDLSIEK